MGQKKKRMHQRGSSRRDLAVREVEKEAEMAWSSEEQRFLEA